MTDSLDSQLAAIRADEAEAVRAYAATLALQLHGFLTNEPYRMSDDDTDYTRAAACILHAAIEALADDEPPRACALLIDEAAARDSDTCQDLNTAANGGFGDDASILLITAQAADPC